MTKPAGERLEMGGGRNRVFPAIIRSQSISCHCRSSMQSIYHSDTQTYTLNHLHSHIHFHDTHSWRANGETDHSPFGNNRLAVGFERS